MQEAIALGIVALAVFYLGRQGFEKHVAPGLSQWLLKRGQVKWAMRLRHLGRKRSLGSSCH